MHAVLTQSIVRRHPALVLDLRGLLTPQYDGAAGEGIYFAAKSGRMCAEAIVEGSAQGKKMIGERDLRVYLDK